MTEFRDSVSFRMTDRDLKILQIIGKCGGLTAEQVGRHFFEVPVVNGKIATHSNGQRRMKFLKNAGFVQRIERYQLLSEGKKPYLYTLTESGAECLAEYLGCKVEDLEWRKKDTRLRHNYIEHLILTNDVRLAIMKSIEKKPDMELLFWHDELELEKINSRDKIPIEVDGKTQYVKLIPDAFFVFTQSEVSRYCFLEIDRGTQTIVSNDETYRTWERKVKTYINYFKSGLYEQMAGTISGRVLTVTTSEQRRDRLLEVSEKVGALQRFWFTTHKDSTQPWIEKVTTPEGEEKLVAVSPDIIRDPIWKMAKDTTDRLHRLCETREQLK